MSSPTWRITAVDHAVARRLSSELGISRVLAEVLARRGFVSSEEARAFLEPDYRVHSPYLMAGMAAARARIDRALKRDEAIVVHGDYDADGVTAAFLLSDVLGTLGARVSWRLPNRFTEGYGLSVPVIERLAAEGAGLLVTVDCGVRDVAAVARARELGVDVIVTDHHEIGDELPDCIVVSPRLGGYPFPHLAGVGVALKLAHALLQEPAGERGELPLQLRPYLDVVAVGTVADVVPLLDENRVLVAMGIGRLRSGPRPGLAALMEVSGTAADAVTAGVIGFRLAPRINAAGRLEDASIAMELLAAGERQVALPLALKLNELNAGRQEIERGMLDEALAMVGEPLSPGLVLSSPDWHEGVVGIVAARVAEQLGRPTILLREGEEESKGSGRSIPGFDLFAAVRACSEPLLAYGGHQAACGLRLPTACIERFRRLFTAFAGSVLGPEQLRRRLSVDAVVAGDEITLGLADELERLAPHGFGNPPVTLLLHGAEVLSPRLTRDRRHVQCRVRCDGACASAIHFNFNGVDQITAGARFDVPLELAKNSYNGAVNAQVKVRALLPLLEGADDLCATPCSGACPHRLKGAALLELLERGGWAGPQDDDTRLQAAFREAQRGGRLVDARRRPVLSAVTSLLAGGGRTLLLVADVARRRPLLSRDLPLEPLGLHGMYLNGACAAARLGEALGEASPSAAPGVVVASSVTAAATPQLVAAFERIVFIDPPFDRRALMSVVAAADEHADVHALWGEDEVDFAGKVAAGEYDLDALLRRSWRALAAAAGEPLAAAFERDVYCGGVFLAKLPPLAAAWRTLRETGLLVDEGGNNQLVRGRSKVDLTAAETYRAWHQRFPHDQYLQRCLTTTL